MKGQGNNESTEKKLLVTSPSSWRARIVPQLRTLGTSAKSLAGVAASAAKGYLQEGVKVAAERFDATVVAAKKVLFDSSPQGILDKLGIELFTEEESDTIIYKRNNKWMKLETSLCSMFQQEFREFLTPQEFDQYFETEENFKQHFTEPKFTTELDTIIQTLPIRKKEIDSAISQLEKLANKPGAGEAGEFGWKKGQQTQTRSYLFALFDSYITLIGESDTKAADKIGEPSHKAATQRPGPRTTANKILKEVFRDDTLLDYHDYHEVREMGLHIVMHGEDANNTIEKLYEKLIPKNVTDAAGKEKLSKESRALEIVEDLFISTLFADDPRRKVAKILEEVLKDGTLLGYCDIKSTVDMGLHILRGGEDQDNTIEKIYEKLIPTEDMIIGVDSVGKKVLNKRKLSQAGRALEIVDKFFISTLTTEDALRMAVIRLNEILNNDKFQIHPNIESIVTIAMHIIKSGEDEENSICNLDKAFYGDVQQEAAKASSSPENIEQVSEPALSEMKVFDDQESKIDTPVPAEQLQTAIGDAYKVAEKGDGQIEGTLLGEEENLVFSAKLESLQHVSPPADEKNPDVLASVIQPIVDLSVVKQEDDKGMQSLLPTEQENLDYKFGTVVIGEDEEQDNQDIITQPQPESVSYEPFLLFDKNGGVVAIKPLVVFPDVQQVAEASMPRELWLEDEIKRAQQAERESRMAMVPYDRMLDPSMVSKNIVPTTQVETLPGLVGVPTQQDLEEGRTNVAKQVDERDLVDVDFTVDEVVKVEPIAEPISLALQEKTPSSGGWFFPRQQGPKKTLQEKGGALQALNEIQQFLGQNKQKVEQYRNQLAEEFVKELDKLLVTQRRCDYCFLSKECDVYFMLKPVKLDEFRSTYPEQKRQAYIFTEEGTFYFTDGEIQKVSNKKLSEFERLTRHYEIHRGATDADLQTIISLKGYPQPTYVFTQERLFYCKGGKVVDIEISDDYPNQRKLDKLKEALNITTNDKDKLLEELSDEQLRMIISGGGLDLNGKLLEWIALNLVGKIKSHKRDEVYFDRCAVIKELNAILQREANGFNGFKNGFARVGDAIKEHYPTLYSAAGKFFAADELLNYVSACKGKNGAVNYVEGENTKLDEINSHVTFLYNSLQDSAMTRLEVEIKKILLTIMIKIGPFVGCDISKQKKEREKLDTESIRLRETHMMKRGLYFIKSSIENGKTLKVVEKTTKKRIPMMIEVNPDCFNGTPANNTL